jgi:hypothetical protein
MNRNLPTSATVLKWHVLGPCHRWGLTRSSPSRKAHFGPQGLGSGGHAWSAVVLRAGWHGSAGRQPHSRCGRGTQPLLLG